MTRCKITALKLLKMDDLVYEIMGPQAKPIYCDRLKAGDVFITSGVFGNEMPVGFCANAWAAIEEDAIILASGGKIKNRDLVHVAACNDGLRPVIFLLEAYDDGIALELPD